MLEPSLAIVISCLWRGKGSGNPVSHNTSDFSEMFVILEITALRVSFRVYGLSCASCIPSSIFGLATFLQVWWSWGALFLLSVTPAQRLPCIAHHHFNCISFKTPSHECFFPIELHVSCCYVLVRRAFSLLYKGGPIPWVERPHGPHNQIFTFDLLLLTLTSNLCFLREDKVAHVWA